MAVILCLEYSCIELQGPQGSCIGVALARVSARGELTGPFCHSLQGGCRLPGKVGLGSTSPKDNRAWTFWMQLQSKTLTEGFFSTRLQPAFPLHLQVQAQGQHCYSLAGRPLSI